MTEDNESAVWAEIFQQKDGSYNFRFRYPNGRIAGHDYDTEKAAVEGLSDLLDALVEGFHWNLETRLLRDDS